MSRLPLLGDEGHVDDEISYLNYFHNDDVVIDFKLIQRETKSDSTLNEIKKFVQKGWPQFNRVSLTLQDYYKYRNEITTENDCLIWNNKIIIPLTLRQAILKDLHRTRMGMVKLKSLARSYFWWPNLNVQIEGLVSRCEACAHFRNSPEKCKPQIWEWPKEAWSRLHTDYLGPIKGKYYLIILDAHSKWVEVFSTDTITTRFTIHSFRTTFARYGLPRVIVSDNGKQFTSNEMNLFLKNNGIEAITTAPYHPQSNGAAENVVKTFKNALKKCLYYNNKDDVNLVINHFLMDYRNTPHVTTGKTPACLLF